MKVRKSGKFLGGTVNLSQWILKLPSYSRGKTDIESGFALTQAHPAQHVFIFAWNHELGKDVIHPCALTLVMAVTPKRGTELE